MNPNKRPNMKLLAAVIGGSALVATGALSVAIGQEKSSPATVMGSSMTTGVTSTVEVAATTPLTTFAVPPVKAPRFGKS